jgi:hypothetical protein
VLKVGSSESSDVEAGNCPFGILIRRNLSSQSEFFFSSWLGDRPTIIPEILLYGTLMVGGFLV